MTREARTVTSSRLRRTAVAVAFAALALTGCSADQAGAASVVGDQVVTDAQVSDIVSQLQTELASRPGTIFDEKAATKTTITAQTRHLILDAVAAKEGITVTQGQIDAFLSDIVTNQFGGNRKTLVESLASQSNVPESQIARAARDQLIYNALVAKIASGATTDDAKSQAFTAYITKFVDEIGVQVAPRFGTWQVFSLGPVPDDLSFVPPSPLGSGSSLPQPLPAG